jgi:two-component system alkaline phosphatase synthesis response regulator PhoP
MPDGSQTPRVLVVDDEPAIRLLVTKALEKNGFEVDTAVDGVDAVHKLETASYDLMVLDVMMPRLDGFGVIEKVDAECAPKILVMTAASPAVLKQLPRDRVVGVITKPFDIRELIDSARTVTEGGGEETSRPQPPGIPPVDMARE